MIRQRRSRSRSINGQSSSEFQKNYSRIKDIISKSEGNVDKQISLARQQANKITDEFKAINRARAAKEVGNEDIFEVFFRRAYELGKVPTQEYRDYVISRLLV